MEIGDVEVQDVEVAMMPTMQLMAYQKATIIRMEIHGHQKLESMRIH